MKAHQYIVLLLVVTSLVVRPLLAPAQSLVDSGSMSTTSASVIPELPAVVYTRPTEATKLRNFSYDTFGPYPLVGAALIAGVDQATNTPPEWKQGAQSYSERFGSDFGILAVSTTTHYALAEAFKEDTLYYRCECRGIFPRLSHAVVSTLTGRHGEDGHRFFSVPALVAPYAGAMTAVYGWYPDRYGAKDGFRMGNYSLLEDVVGNIALEFVHGGPHSLLSHLHLNNAHGSPTQ